MTYRPHPNPSAQSGSTERLGFTLVEILVVIAIIAILAATLIPAINAGYKTVLTGSIKAECAAFENAIDAYRLKYGDYPPDFTDMRLAERHYRRVFPEILESEITLLRALTDNIADGDTSPVSPESTVRVVPCLIDRAEALVFAVGGFSSDAQRPFTGVGGPFSFFGTTAQAGDPQYYQYNVARDNALMDLEASKLTVAPINAGGGLSPGNRTMSSDDPNHRSTSDLHQDNDVFPVYRSNELSAPYIYFDSRTYDLVGADLMVHIPKSGTDAKVLSNQYPNGFATGVDGELDGIRPVFSATVNTSGSRSGDTGFDDALGAWMPVNERTFQVLNSGIDGRYGEITPNAAVVPYWQYPTGNLIVADQSSTGGTLAAGVLNGDVQNYNASSTGTTVENFAKDNVANFTNGSFENDLP